MMTRRPFECLSEEMLILLPFNSFCKKSWFCRGDRCYHQIVEVLGYFSSVGSHRI